ncbi:hypothetical protein BJ878DRAFT_394840, partial [Calycina marina]
GRNLAIWIHDAWAAYELFEKRAQLYSSSLRMVVFGELALGKSNMVSMRRDDAEMSKWRAHRRLMYLSVGVQVVGQYRDAQNDES